MNGTGIPTALIVVLLLASTLLATSAEKQSLMGQLESLLVPFDAPTPGETATGSAESAALRKVGLQTGKLQASCGVQSGARGLTPEGEWRRMFPRKPGQ